MSGPLEEESHLTKFADVNFNLKNLLCEFVQSLKIA